jgi:hypothetical protein
MPSQGQEARPSRPLRGSCVWGLRRLCEARGFWMVFSTWRVLFYPDAVQVSP